jgi:hypothetical protein
MNVLCVFINEPDLYKEPRFKSFDVMIKIPTLVEIGPAFDKPSPTILKVSDVDKKSDL